MDLQGQERLLWHGRLRTSVVMVTEKFRFSWEKEQTALASGLENLNGSYVYSLTRWGTDLTAEWGCRQILDIAFKLLLSSLDPLYLHLRPRLTVFPFDHHIHFCFSVCQAYLMRPSIIFFDEIDGLAPVRSSRQDQIHR